MHVFYLLTLSMTASDKIVDRNPVAARATEAAKPGRPKEQNIVTEKYLFRCVEVKIIARTKSDTLTL